jgi:predicted regulator of Ras-like GTPase activity (Roadblock/LC7/MglB family)
MTMTIPFLSFFKKVKDQALAKKERPVAAPKPAAPLDKPSSERFSKTVMPNATRTLPPQDPFEMAARSPAGTVSMPSASPGPSAATAARPRDLPPAVALALEPRVERVISLDLADIAAQIPSDYIKPIESIDGTRRILLKSSEVERGMASGKPAVSLATIYQQVPEIFLRSIAPGDEAQVPLPFEKVLQQFSSLQVRSDQERHQSVPQVETPFLKVTLEDNSRFGTTTEQAVEIGDLPPVRIELATAEAYAAAEPDTTGNGFVQHSRSENAPPPPTRIPFKLSPNGTGGPAPESVPASSGPSVPTTLAAGPAPTRIPFKMTAPSDDLRQKDEPWLTAESLASVAPAPVAPPTLAPPSVAPPSVAPPSVAPPSVAPPSVAPPSVAPPSVAPPSVALASVALASVAPPAAVAPTSESKPETTIALALKPILQGLPPFQLGGDPGGVPAETRIDLPFSLIEPQLASGRITLTPAVFEAALPKEYRGLFKTSEATGDIMLPLHEVLKNLPTASLRMRDDQEEQEAGANFATPFSAKADEDAKRFNLAGKTAAKSIVPPPAEPVAVAPEMPAVPAPIVAAPVATAPVEMPLDPLIRDPLQVALDTDEKLDAKGAVAHLNKLAGVKSCALMFGDGLSLAGSLPPEYGADGLCAMAPSLIKRIENHMVETNLGPLQGMTLSCAKAAVTFFMHENLCLAALHASGELTSEVREKLARVVHELSRKYSHPI